MQLVALETTRKREAFLQQADRDDTRLASERTIIFF